MVDPCIEETTRAGPVPMTDGLARHRVRVRARDDEPL